MKKLLLLVALTLAFSFTALAQGTSAAGGTESTSKTTTTEKTTKSKKAAAGDTAGATKGGAKAQTMTGCLGKDAAGSGYTLTNGNYKKGVAVSSSEDLSAHVGHTVQLTGTMDKSAKPPTFTATKMKHISGTCAAGGKAAAKGAPEKKGAKTGEAAPAAPPKS